MKFHLIAIGGTGMGAVAGLLAEAGHEVRGSDLPLYPPMSTLLARLEIPVFQGYAPANLDWNPDLVVLGNTCSARHVEYVAAKELELPIVSFPQLLSEYFLSERHSIVVAGTHGKTTTTSLLAHVLASADLDPGFLIGGVPINFGRGFAVGRPPYFVIEGDEYDSACFDKRPKFIHYRPRTAILTGVEFDHIDIYPDIAAVEAAFAQLVERMPADGTMVVAADSARAIRLAQAASCPLQTYDVRPKSESIDVDPAEALWRGRYAPLAGGRQQLEVWRGMDRVGQFEVPLAGRHNMANALAAIAVAHSLGVEAEQMARALRSFTGVTRRQQIRGVVDGVTVIDDFAHHPTAIRETLSGLKGLHGDGQLIAVFEPRSSTSRRNVFRHDLPRALERADRVFVAPLFQPEKVPEDQRLDLPGVIGDLQAKGREAQVLPVAEIVSALARSCHAGDTVVVMSSGGFDSLVDRLLAALRQR